MKKFLALPLIIIGAIFIILCGAYLLSPKSQQSWTKYNPLYVGIGGVGLLSVGLLIRND